MTKKGDRSPNAISEEVIAEARQMVASGMSRYQTGKTLGISATSVHRYTADITPQPTTKPLPTETMTKYLANWRAPTR